MPGVVLGYTQERLFDLGALDVWYTPIQMKKNRPATILSALVPVELEGAAFELIMRETPTLGIRTRPVERYVADRRNVTIETELGVIDVKLKSLEGVTGERRSRTGRVPTDCPGNRAAVSGGISAHHRGGPPPALELNHGSLCAKQQQNLTRRSFMYDFAKFTEGELKECGTTLQTLGSGASSMEDAANKIVRYLYDNITDSTTSQKSCALVRFLQDSSVQSAGLGTAELCSRNTGLGTTIRRH